MTLKTQKPTKRSRFKVERCVTLKGGHRIGAVWRTETMTNNLTVAERTQQRLMIDYPDLPVRIMERSH